jgi:uncharacterized protein YdcH (DUF465 family)
MEQRDEELIISLLPQNPELAEAWDEHKRLSTAVESLMERSHLTASEEVEKKNLQKRKLSQKDKILGILEQHRRRPQENSSA